MQDEVNQKVVTLCINGGKISARILKDALAKLLKKMEQMERQKLQELKINRKEKGAVSYHGKQSITVSSGLSASPSGIIPFSDNASRLDTLYFCFLSFW